MTYLLRKISHSKWECNKGRAPDNISADAITGCTRTSNNTLSVWVSDSIDFQDESVEKIIVALATTMSEPATIDLVWLIHNGLKIKVLIFLVLKEILCINQLTICIEICQN